MEASKPMKWVVEVATNIVEGNESQVVARAIQDAAEPILAVVREAVDRHGCSICDALADEIKDHGHRKLYFDESKDCPVPAALKAMEDHGS